MKKYYYFALLALSSVLQASVPLDYHVPFDDGMSPRAIKWGKYSDEDHGWYDTVRALYEKNNLLGVTPSEETRIPKIIHQIWIGSPVPERYNNWRASWKKHNPDWEYKLWTDKEVAEFELVNRKLYDATTNLGAKSDILRYELLNQFGGLYVDTDFECCKSFDMLNHSYNFYTGVCNAGGFNLACGLMGSVPGHPVLQECIRSISALETPPLSENEILMNVSVICFTRGFMRGIEQDDNLVVAFPNSYFYPKAHMPPKGECVDCYGKESFAVHHWEGAWATSNKVAVHTQKRFSIVIPSYNNIDYYERNLDSVLCQDYENYRVYYIDDASSDGTGEAVEQYLAQHDTDHKVTYVRNPENYGPLANVYATAHFCDDTQVVVVVDGDDWLADSGVLSHLNEAYQDENVWITFGSYLDYPSMEQGAFARPYLKSVALEGGFRHTPWSASHLRTFYAGLFKKIDANDLVDEQGHFFDACTDLAAMFPMLEMAREHHKFINRTMYIYNRETPLNVHKLKLERQQSIREIISTRKPYKRLKSPFGKAEFLDHPPRKVVPPSHHPPVARRKKREKW